eukprot:TRINITY_DN2486_c0_g1_i6.p2 TRINITY_DN2486_c0_g1~~TRINITY_DN2486_c0_g1_i6.p2  ORF type:complete len:134 (-),score=15.06 TRINITY_DN2486_c0_g1_i6:260-661(-)
MSLKSVLSFPPHPINEACPSVLLLVAAVIALGPWATLADCRPPLCPEEDPSKVPRIVFSVFGGVAVLFCCCVFIFRKRYPGLCTPGQPLFGSSGDSNTFIHSQHTNYATLSGSDDTRTTQPDGPTSLPWNGPE